MKSGFPSFLASMFLSKLGDQILLFLVPLVVYQTTKSVAWSGLAFFAEALPRFLAFPACGALCDRKSPLKLLRASQLYRAIFCAGGILASELLGGIGWLIALSAICGVLTTQGVMAREVMLPNLFKERQLHSVLAYAQTADQAGSVLGPLFAALLLDWSPWEAVIGVAACLFLSADVALIVWQRGSHAELPEPDSNQGSWLAPIKTALIHVRDVPGLSKLVILAAGVNLIVGVTLASSAALVTGLYARGAGYYAGLQTAGAIATVLILLLIARSAIPLKMMVLLSYALICVGGFLTALSSSHWGYAAGFLLVIGFDKMFNIYIRISRQKIIPVRDYGKTTGVIVMLNNLTQPLAGLLIGVFSGAAETGWVIFFLSFLMGALGVAAAMVAPLALANR